jgi:cytidylate kinase
MSLPRTVAIEGPAACGKSTIGRMLAAKLGYAFVDSGMLYRLIARQVLLDGVAPENEPAVVALARALDIEIRSAALVVGGREVDQDTLHTPEVDRTVPLIARYGGVRERVRVLQRAVAANGGIVMAGRDIGTVVLPDADLKVYLSVSLEERARRRLADMARLGQTVSMEEILEDLKRRDELDAHRELSPMRPAADAVFIDADHLSPDQIVAALLP